MSDKKKIVIIMNCAGLEIAAGLRSCPNVNFMYDIQEFTTYVHLSDDTARREIHEAVSRADVLITQNVKEIDWLTNEVLADHIKATCLFIRLVFWRFDGFWPLAQDRKIGAMWYFPLEAGNVPSFEDYINFDIPGALITEKFQQGYEKFCSIDAESDIPMKDFFNQNYQNYNLFTDSWHPTSYFYHTVCNKILEKMGISQQARLRPNDLINRDRYRFVFNAVADTLGMEYDRSMLRYGDYNIRREVYFDFSRYAIDRLKTQDTREAEALFRSWSVDQGYRVRASNVAPRGYASQSSFSQWSWPTDPQRAVSGTPQGGYAFHTDNDPSPWWSVDLRDFREISNIVIWNRDGHGVEIKRRATPLIISYSIDAARWRPAMTAHHVFGGAVDGLPLRIDFSEPVVARHVKLQLDKPGTLHLDQVQVFSPVLETLPLNRYNLS